MKKRNSQNHIFLIIALLTIFACSKSKEPEEFQFTIISWNVQTFGDLNENRQPFFKDILPELMKEDNCILVAQEVANDDGCNYMLQYLPGGDPVWDYSFQNTSDSQDNGIWYNSRKVSLNSEGFVFNDPDKARHPIRWAHISVRGFDFTVFSLHLTFQGGNAEAQKEELIHLLDYLVEYFNDPDNDPDVIICGDFNLATDQGKPLSDRADDDSWITINEILNEHDAFDDGPNQLWVYVPHPTSRPNKVPANNYDHFIISNSLKDNLVKSERCETYLVDNLDLNSTYRVSDHYPIYAIFKVGG
jgi:exonuclease III